MDLQDRVIVVTGASSGLGRAFAELLVEKGAHVYGLARSRDTLQVMRDDLGDHFHPLPCDVQEEEAVNDAFDTILREKERIDGLINNAGLGRFGPVEDLSLEDWDRQMNTNLRGIFLCTRAAVPPMKKQNEKVGFGGHIINISSTAGLVGNPNLSAYNATKFGVRGFSEALMKELRDEGIKVSCVSPGTSDTNFFNDAGAEMTSKPMQPESLARTIAHIFETPHHYLISELVTRPLRPKE